MEELIIKIKHDISVNKRCLEERNFDVNLKLLASSRSAGKVFTFNNQKVTVEELTENSFDDVD